MSNNQTRFNQAAATWDENPRAVAIAQAVVECLLQEIPLNANMEAMDFGCGTGLIALPLAAHLKQITAIDSAEQMLAVCTQKCMTQGINTVSCQATEVNQLPEQTFDLIYSCMTLHHIEDTAALLKQFNRLLRPAGYLALADLDQEDGHFHDDGTGVKHYGFDRTHLSLNLQRQGFTVITIKTAHTIYKQTDSGVYPIFFLVAQKNIN